MQGVVSEHCVSNMGREVQEESTEQEAQQSPQWHQTTTSTRSAAPSPRLLNLLELLTFRVTLFQGREGALAQT